MPASTVSVRERRLSTGSTAGRPRRRPASSSSANSSVKKGDSASLSAPSLVTTPEPGLQSILVQPASSNNDAASTSHHADHEPTSSNNTASSYLKPLLKFLPKHIDPSTIARLLKNVHPTAFGSYRTKEAWRREHPEVVSTAHFLNKRDEERERARRSGNSSVDIETSEAVLRGASGEDDFCLAHSPPSATFSSSSSSDDDEDDAKELDEYFNDSDDDDDNDDNDNELLSDTDSMSSLDSVSSFAAQSGRQQRHRRQQRGVKNVSRARDDREEQGATTQQRIQQEQHAGGDGDDVQVVLSPVPLAIVLSRPDDEEAVLDERGHVLGNQTTPINRSGASPHDDGSSGDAQSSDESTAIIVEDAGIPASGLASTALTSRQARDSSSYFHSLAATTTNGQDAFTSGSTSISQTSTSSHSVSTSPNRSPALSPSFPPSPPRRTSSTSPLPSPSTSYTPPLASPSPSSSSSLSVHSSSSRAGPSSTQSTSSNASAAPPAYPTIQLLKSVRRQRSSSSLASACTCRSNASNASAASASSTASRTSSVRFGPVPEEALARRRSREQSTESSNVSSSAEGERRSSSKSAVMGVRGRKNLLRGKTEDGISVDEILRGSSPASGAARLAVPEQRSNGNTANANLGYRRPVLSESETEQPDQDEDDDDDDYAIGDSDNDSGSGDGKERRFDAIAFFGEEDPLASTTSNNHHRKASSSSSASAYFRVDPQQYARGSAGHATSSAGGVYRSSSSAASTSSSSSAAIKKRTASDATILVGRNGELVERRPLGVTLEELTLPMKRVKETRGRSRQTNDLSASFTSKAALASGLPSSPPTSPRLPSLATLPPLSDQSPSRSYLHRSAGMSPSSSSSAPLSTMTSGESGSPQNDKTPTATPRFEKLDLFLTTVHSPPAMSSRKFPSTTASSTAMSPSNSSLSPTSPTHSQGSHSHTITTHGSSNDITPMATPRAGSPIAGLKMTAAAVLAHTEAVSKGFMLDERFMVARSASPATSTSSSLSGIAVRSDINASNMLPAVDSPSVESALPSLTNSADSSPEPEEQEDAPLHAARIAEGDNAADDDDGYSDASDDEDAENAGGAGHDDTVVIAQSDDDDDGDGGESAAELDVKTPTLGSCLSLPELRCKNGNTARTAHRKKKPIVAGARRVRPAAGTTLVKKAKKT